MSTAASSRRHALREFYKLSAPSSSSPSSPTTSSPPSPTTPSTKDETSTDPSSPLEAPSSIVRNLLLHNDLKSLLHHENNLVAEIKSLDSEQKALVYNNYSKLTAASSILSSLATDPALDDEKKSHIQSTVVAVGALTANDSGTQTSTKETDSTSKETDTITDLTKTAQWLFSVPRQLASLHSRPTVFTRIQSKAVEVLDYLLLNSGPGLLFAFDHDELRRLKDEIQLFHL